MTLDTEATIGVTVLSIAVLFDDANLHYNQGASSNTSYSKYVGKGGVGFLGMGGSVWWWFGPATARDAVHTADRGSGTPWRAF